jgi:hypothetical protein
VDGALGKIIRLRKKLGGATAAVRGLFGAGEEQDDVVAALEGLQERIRLVQRLFRWGGRGWRRWQGWQGWRAAGLAGLPGR